MTTRGDVIAILGSGAFIGAFVEPYWVAWILCVIAGWSYNIIVIQNRKVSSK